MGYKIPSNSHPMIGGQGEMCEINWTSQSLRISNDWDFQFFQTPLQRRIQGFVWIGVMTSQDGEAVPAPGCWAGEFGLWVFFAFSAVGCSVRMSPIWKKGPVSGCGKVESCWDWIVWMMLNTFALSSLRWFAWNHKQMPLHPNHTEIWDTPEAHTRTPAPWSSPWWWPWRRKILGPINAEYVEMYTVYSIIQYTSCTVTDVYMYT